MATPPQLTPEQRAAALVKAAEARAARAEIKARRVMSDIEIADNRRVQGLGAQQKLKLLELLG